MVITLFGRPARRRPNRTGSRTAPPPFLDDSQWFLIAHLFPHPPITGRGGRPRTAAGLSGGRVVGAPQRRPMERFTRAISLSCNLLATTAGVDEGRRLPASLETSAGAAGRSEADQLGGSAGRRHVFPRKKGGARSATPRKAKAPRFC